jgi:signal transduction histidine kinase
VIFVRVGRRDNDAVVTVENEGPELPAATTVTLFDPLVREDAKRPKAASEAKLGIDLYIARQIVLAHGGVISAGYQAGKNCVTVVLPVQQLAKAPQSPQEA